jgi:hypothetical protein
MEDNTLIESSFTTTINAPIEAVDIPAWCFTLAESEYQACSPAHYAADWQWGQTKGKSQSIRRLELIGLILSSGTAGCHSWRMDSRPLPEILAGAGADRVQVRGADTMYLELRHPTILGDSVLGEHGGSRHQVAVALSGIQQTRTLHADGLKTAGLVAMIVGVTFGVAAIGAGGSYFRAQ